MMNINIIITVIHNLTGYKSSQHLRNQHLVYKAAHAGLCYVFSFWISGLESSLSSFTHPLYYDMLLIKKSFLVCVLVLFSQQKLFLEIQYVPPGNPLCFIFFWWCSILCNPIFKVSSLLALGVIPSDYCKPLSLSVFSFFFFS